MCQQSWRSGYRRRVSVVGMPHDGAGGTGSEAAGCWGHCGAGALRATVAAATAGMLRYWNVLRTAISPRDISRDSMPPNAAFRRVLFGFGAQSQILRTPKSRTFSMILSVEAPEFTLLPPSSGS